MKQYTDVYGTSFTEADLERMAEEAEKGYPGWTFSKPVPGRPVSVGRDARPFTLRLDSVRRDKVQALAEARGITVSQLVRELIDAA